MPKIPEGINATTPEKSKDEELLASLLLIEKTTHEARQKIFKRTWMFLIGTVLWILAVFGWMTYVALTNG